MFVPPQENPPSFPAEVPKNGSFAEFLKKHLEGDENYTPACDRLASQIVRYRDLRKLEDDDIDTLTVKQCQRLIEIQMSGFDSLQSDGKEAMMGFILNNLDAEEAQVRKVFQYLANDEFRAKAREECALLIPENAFIIFRGNIQENIRKLQNRIIEMNNPR